MRHYVHSALIATMLAGWLAADSGIANAGYGRGGGCRNGNCRNRSGSATYGTAKPATAPSKAGTRAVGVPLNNHTSVNVPQARTASVDRAGTTTQPKADRPRTIQRDNEEGKLTHRLEIADRLEQLGVKNGNEYLQESAERMRQKAHALSDKRSAKIDSRMLFEEAEEPSVARSFDRRHFVNALSNTAEDDLSETLSAWSDHENAVRQQLRTEERWLGERLELAERLREIAGQKGTPGLSKAADYLEQGGLNRFEKRAEEIRSFQERQVLAVEG
jgi:hypothetical protein